MQLHGIHREGGRLLVLLFLLDHLREVHVEALASQATVLRLLRLDALGDVGVALLLVVADHYVLRIRILVTANRPVVRTHALVVGDPFVI